MFLNWPRFLLTAQIKECYKPLWSVLQTVWLCPSIGCLYDNCVQFKPKTHQYSLKLPLLHPPEPESRRNEVGAAGGRRNWRRLNLEQQCRAPTVRSKFPKLPEAFPRDSYGFSIGMSSDHWKLSGLVHSPKPGQLAQRPQPPEHGSDHFTWERLQASFGRSSEPSHQQLHRSEGSHRCGPWRCGNSREEGSFMQELWGFASSPSATHRSQFESCGGQRRFERFAPNQALRSGIVRGHAVLCVQFVPVSMHQRGEHYKASGERTQEQDIE